MKHAAKIITTIVIQLMDGRAMEIAAIIRLDLNNGVRRAN
jgi:hypothetical protein